MSKEGGEGQRKKKKSLANNMFFPSFLHNDPRDLMKPVSSETDVKIPKKNTPQQRPLGKWCHF